MHLKKVSCILLEESVGSLTWHMVRELLFFPSLRVLLLCMSFVGSIPSLGFSDGILGRMCSGIRGWGFDSNTAPSPGDVHVSHVHPVNWPRLTTLWC